MSKNYATPRNEIPRRLVRFNTPGTTTPSATGNSKNPSRRLSAAFKSPLRQLDENSPQISFEHEGVSLQKEIDALRAKEIQLDKEIESLIALGCQAEELNDHIQKLHDYNEIKDIGQMLLGRIAVQHGVTTKDLYAQYGLSLDD